MTQQLPSPLWPTLAKNTQGQAVAKPRNQIKLRIFWVFLAEYLERKDVALQIAKYLNNMLWLDEELSPRKPIFYLSRVNPTIESMDTLVKVSVRTTLASQANSPNGQGYCCHIRNTSMGSARIETKNIYFFLLWNFQGLLERPKIDLILFKDLLEYPIRLNLNNITYQSVLCQYRWMPSSVDTS